MICIIYVKYIEDFYFVHVIDAPFLGCLLDLIIFSQQGFNSCLTRKLAIPKEGRGRDAPGCREDGLSGHFVFLGPSFGSF